jgi:deoxyribodipyrimidine photolyase
MRMPSTRASAASTTSGLARGSGDRLWDLAQRSLLVHGELHNNLRMTWAKAIPGWTQGPRARWRS